MAFQDKSIVCADCGTAFTFSVKDQEFFQTKGFTNEPKRCPECRQSKKAERNGGSFGNRSYGAPRQMFPATCGECGKSTEVPFQPRGDKPVYCSDCFSKMRPSR
jgi:CxxC-x17-CxxC domain-containing protein